MNLSHHLGTPRKNLICAKLRGVGDVRVRFGFPTYHPPVSDRLNSAHTPQRTARAKAIKHMFCFMFAFVVVVYWNIVNPHGTARRDMHPHPTATRLQSVHGPRAQGRRGRSGGVRTATERRRHRALAQITHRARSAQLAGQACQPRLHLALIHASSVASGLGIESLEIRNFCRGCGTLTR